MLVIVWFIAFIISLVALILAAASGQGALHMAIAAIVALLFAIIAVREDRRLRSENASEQLVAASNARHMGFVWAWGAAGLFLTYTFILSWHEWLTFFIAFVIAAALCLFFSNILRRDAEAGKNDETISSLARYLTIGQLVGMIVTMVGLWLDGKMERFLNARQGWEDWAANNFFFFGAMALVIISANALYTSSRSSSTAEAKNNSNT